MLKKVMASSLFALCASCGSGNSTDGYNAQQAAEAARTLPLKERYRLYQENFDKQRPPDVSLADDVATLGRPAFQLAFERLKGGRSNEILAAIEVIGIAVDNGEASCSSSDFGDAARNITTVFHRQKTAALVTRRLEVACYHGAYSKKRS